MANDYLPVKRRIYFANNSSRNSIVDGAAAALAQKRLPSSQRIHLQVFLGRPKIASDIHCWKKKRDFLIIRSKVGGFLSLTVDGNEYFVG